MPAQVRTPRFLAVAIALVALGSGLATAAGTQAAGPRTVRAAYGPDRVNQALTVYEPGTPGSHRAILFIHGGCWSRGTLNSYEVAFARELARRTGWVVATMTYRTRGAKWAVQPQDVHAALRRLQTGGYGVDPRRVALWGESAGGHLALLEGLRGSGRPGVGRAAAVVSVSGVSDMRTLLATGNSTASACVEDFEAGPPESKEMADRYAATSPFSWADGSDPATFLANGLQDRLVPATQAAQLVAMLDSIQVRASLALSSTDHHATGLEHDSVAGESATVVSAALAFLTQTL